MPPSTENKKEPATWYDEGLRFTCTQCGNCCGGPSGFVWFSDEEAQAMADHLGVSVAVFRERYAHKTFGQWTLGEVQTKDGQYDCVFLETTAEGKRTCSIYEVRPTQCRTWPFWPENLKSQTTYVRAAQRCPGMQNGLKGEGRLYPIEQIRIVRDRQRQTHH